MSASPGPGALPAADFHQTACPVYAAQQLCVDRDSQSAPRSRQLPGGAEKDSCGHSHWLLPLSHRPFPGLQHLVIELLSFQMLLTEEIIFGTPERCHYISRLKFDQVDTRNVVAPFAGARLPTLCLRYEA